MLLADEVTSELDAINRQKVLELLREEAELIRGWPDLPGAATIADTTGAREPR